MRAQQAYSKDQGSFYSPKTYYLTVIYILTIEITEQAAILTSRKTSMTARAE
jgi:hypothetical protein